MDSAQSSHQKSKLLACAASNRAILSASLNFFGFFQMLEVQRVVKDSGEEGGQASRSRRLHRVVILRGGALWFTVGPGTQSALSLIPAPLLPRQSAALGLLGFINCKTEIKVVPLTWGYFI